MWKFSVALFVAALSAGQKTLPCFSGFLLKNSFGCDALLLADERTECISPVEVGFIVYILTFGSPGSWC